MRILMIAAALFTALPAMAQAPAASRAVLADAASSSRTVIDGATWRCEGTACTATGGTSQPAPRACRRVKAKLGSLTAFTWKGQTLSADQLAACNA